MLFFEPIGDVYRLYSSELSKRVKIRDAKLGKEKIDRERLCCDSLELKCLKCGREKHDIF